MNKNQDSSIAVKKRLRK